MNVFEVKKIINESYKALDEWLYDFQKEHLRIQKEIHKKFTVLNEKVIGYMLSEIPEKERHVILKHDELKNYSESKPISMESVLIALKKYSQQYKEAKKTFSKSKEKYREILSKLKECNKLTSELSVLEVEKLNCIVLGIRTIIDEKFGYSISEYDMIHLLLSLKQIDKNNFLSLLELNHTADTMNDIRKLSEKLSFEDVTRCIFIDRIESDDNCWMFDIFFNEFMRKLDEDKELREETNKKLGIDRIPSYTVTTDVFGDIQEVKQNKPKLELIKGDVVK